MFYVGQTRSKKTSIIFIFEGDSAFFVQVVKCLKKKGKSGRCDDIKIYPLTEMKVAESQIGRSSGGGGMDSWRQRERDRDGKDNERNEQK